jgi:hypothetical protein
LPRDDQVLLNLVADAHERGVTVGTLVDSRPALRELLYVRNTQLRRPWRPLQQQQQQPDPLAAFEVVEDRIAQQLRAGEQLRWHADLLHHDQRMHSLDSESD